MFLNGDDISTKADSHICRCSTYSTKRERERERERETETETETETDRQTGKCLVHPRPYTKQAVVYDIFTPSTYLISYAIGFERTVSANEQFFVGAQMEVTL